MHVDVHSETIQIAGNQIAYRRQGSGPDVVFVHGWPLHRETWRNVAQALPGFTCHLFDLPGAGQSSSAGQTMSFDGLADITVRIIDHLELDELVLVGHDSGGMIARLAAQTLGRRVTGLVLSGTEIPGHHTSFIEMLVRAAQLPGAARIGQWVMRRSRICRSKYVFGSTVMDRNVLDGDFRRWFLDPLSADRPAMQRTLDFLSAFSRSEVDALRHVHPQITAPVLAVWGRQDPFFPVGKARAMMDEFGGPTEFHVIDNARLFVHEEHASDFAKLVARFLSP